jgi:hypothetical protein
MNIELIKSELIKRAEVLIEKESKLPPAGAGMMNKLNGFMDQTVRTEEFQKQCTNIVNALLTEQGIASVTDQERETLLSETRPIIRDLILKHFRA